MQSVSDDDVRKRLLERTRLELASKGVFRLGRCYIFWHGRSRSLGQQLGKHGYYEETGIIREKLRLCYINGGLYTLDWSQSKLFCYCWIISPSRRSLMMLIWSSLSFNSVVSIFLFCFLASRDILDPAPMIHCCNITWRKQSISCGHRGTFYGFSQAQQKNLNYMRGKSIRGPSLGLDYRRRLTIRTISFKVM